MIKDLIWVGLGGFMGSSIRYIINVSMIKFSWPVPWPTFLINLSGSFLIGILMAISMKEHQYWRLFLVTGFCGGFTTFSTFSFENLRLWQEGHEQVAILYMISSLLGGISFVFFGYFITQKLFG